MLKYAICEILGKQYKVIPNKILKINFNSGAGKGVEANVLLLVEDGKLRVGQPYLKQRLVLKALGNVSSEKIRVAKFHAKANYRRVKGSRGRLTRVILDVKKS